MGAEAAAGAAPREPAVMPLQDGVSVSLDAHAGLEHFSYGPQTGDWQLVAGLDGNANGELANVLFGTEAQGAGNFQGDAKVTFSPSGAPLTLEVSGSGDGVWDIAPAQHKELNVPGSSSSEGGSTGAGSTGGGAGGSGKSGGEGGKEPLLQVQSDTSGGSGYGSVFTGELSLTNNPQAVQDLNSILQGDTSTIPDLVDQMNAHGTETLQSYQITRSSSNFGAAVIAGPGAGVGLHDGSAKLTYNPPKTREDGGKWHH